MLQYKVLQHMTLQVLEKYQFILDIAVGIIVGSGLYIFILPVFLFQFKNQQISILFSANVNSTYNLISFLIIHFKIILFHIIAIIISKLIIIFK